MRAAILGLGLAALAALASGCGDKKGTEPKGADPSPTPAPPAPPPPVKERTVGVLGPGVAAPDFTAPAHDGTPITLSALRGRPVVLYFYPKDETPG